MDISQSEKARCQLVQSLNSPFFPPHIGTEPGRAKEESRITCMRMLRTPPFFPPKTGEKPYLKAFSRFGLWRNFLNDKIQATISAFRLIKTMSINSKTVEFHQCHAKPHSTYQNNNNNTLFKYIINKHNTRYVFEKEDREVIPIKGPLTELLKKHFKNHKRRR